jgi:hypothetical protein
VTRGITVMPAPGATRTDPTTRNDLTNRSTKMNLMHEDLARAHLSARLGEAHAQRRAHQVALARRLSRRAERAALQARLAVARAL